MTTTDSPALERLSRLPVANIGDAMERLNVCHSAVRSTWEGARLAGPALTVLTRPGDNLYVHRAIEAVRPGQVIVVAGGGDETRALIGELIAGRAKAAGCAGFVLDGAVRDVAVIRALGMPVFARAVTPAGPYKNGPGALDVPVAIGGVVVSPGDYVLGDDDGVAVVTPATATDIAEKAEAKNAQEDAARAAIAEALGEPFPTG
ncbi:RraA family protein [Nocardiopsis mangrovi]|uniref:Putative 4-hydroxy-4-methyl-2-oxoglutarate aldolase n=1 Tax=Nocardiopsis mangrovi TaxID=1179818 RepID=A0ABV9E4G6_9ACTN